MSQEGSQKYQKSFLEDCDQDVQIPAYQLSGDQNAQSVVASFAGASKSNFVLTVTTIMKTVIGSGILSLPYTVSRLGYVFAFFAFIFFQSVIMLTSLFLLKVKNLTKHSNYNSIVYHIFRSKIFQALVSFTILFNNLGVCIAQLIIFKQALRHIFEQFITDKDILNQFYFSQNFFVLILAFLLVPFTLVKKIEKLKFMAFLGVAGIIVFVIALVVNFFAEMSQRNWQNTYTLDPLPADWLQAMPVLPNIMLALGYQMNFFPILKGMKNSSDQKMTKAALTGTGACCFFYLLVGLLGYTLYGHQTPANFLLALSKNDLSPILYFGMNIGFLVSVFFSFPVMFFGARNNFIALMKMVKFRGDRKGYRSVHGDNIEEISSYIEQGDYQTKKRRAKIYFYVYTAILYAIAVGITILVQSIEEVFNIVGAVASNSIAFIFPSMFYIWVVRRKNKNKSFYFYLAIFVFVFFIPLGIAAVTFQFLKQEEHAKVFG